LKNACIFRKKVVKTDRIVITNKRIVVNDYELSLADISDVVVLNRHRAGQAQYTGYSVRSGGNIRTGTHTGNISAKSKTIGDLVIISPDKTDIILRDVADCQGVRDLILALRKNVMKDR
jgi:hypothetical protein